MGTWRDLQRAKGRTDEEIEAGRRAAAAEALGIDLRTLREAIDMAIADVAAAADMTTADVFELERGGNVKIDALRRYMKALGGELEVVAVLGHKRIALHGV